MVDVMFQVHKNHKGRNDFTVFNMIGGAKKNPKTSETVIALMWLGKKKKRPIPKRKSPVASLDQ